MYWHFFLMTFACDRSYFVRVYIYFRHTHILSTTDPANPLSSLLFVLYVTPQIWFQAYVYMYEELASTDTNVFYYMDKRHLATKWANVYDISYFRVFNNHMQGKHISGLLNLSASVSIVMTISNTPTLHGRLSSQITGNSSVFFFNSLIWLTSQRSTLFFLCEGNPPVTGGFPSQRARIRKMIP